MDRVFAGLLVVHFAQPYIGVWLPVISLKAMYPVALGKPKTPVFTTDLSRLGLTVATFAPKAAAFIRPPFFVRPLILDYGITSASNSCDQVKLSPITRNGI
jgi:hypothetical protein